MKDYKTKDAVGSAFSGGVDSLYTLWSHLPDNEPLKPFQITHGLFILGFDLKLSNLPLLEIIATRYRRLFEGLDLELIFAKSNMRQFYEYRVDWMFAHGGH